MCCAVQVVMWLFGTVVGATLGFVLMISQAMATSPYGLMAIICAYTFLVALCGQSQFRVAITLTLMSLSGVVLCQYGTCCSDYAPHYTPTLYVRHGTVRYATFTECV
jgi:hypothetical protein